MTEAKLEKVRSLARASARGDAVVNLELIELDESEAVNEGGAGRTDVVGRIFREHNAALVRFLSAKLPSLQDAQEVAQEAYVRMLRLEETDTISHLQAYLFKVASNLAIDRLRQRKRRPEEEDFDGAVATVQCPMPLPDATFEARQKIKRITEIVAELPPKCRLAFLLYKFKGMAYPDIAARMNLTESMIRKYVLRAVVYCREQLDAPDADRQSSKEAPDGRVERIKW